MILNGAADEFSLFSNLFWSEISKPIGRRHSTIHEEVASGDERTFRPHEESTDGSDFVRCAGSSSRRYFNHAPIARAARPLEFVVRQGRDDDAGADRVDPRSALSPTDGLGHHA